jgi:transcriptional regulator CtsR
MKKSLADGIEQYVKVLIARSEKQQIEIQRAELAETFGCVPSQVTYVLSTRFAKSDGYYTESRRGGMGYVRITQIKPEDGGASEQELLLQLVNELGRQKLLHDRETELLKHIVDQVVVHVPREYQDQVSLGISAGLHKFMEIEAAR